jgi:aspartokinase-like uncharacterized kinase
LPEAKLLVSLYNADTPIMWIIKLGGSLANYPDDLKRWLEELAVAGRGRVVIVPGGGPFVDCVRAAQQDWGFTDSTAHRMALLAMEQYGWMLADIQPGLILARTVVELYQALSNNNIPVWLPSAMIAGNAEIPESWDVTSDSLAAWLARCLDAELLVLVKSCPLPEGETDMAQLSREGIVDAAFPGFVHSAAFDVWPVNRKDYSRVSSHLKRTPAGAELSR